MRKGLPGRGVVTPLGIRVLRNKLHSFKQNFFPSAGAVTITGGSYTASGGLLTGPTTAGGIDCAFSIFWSLADIAQNASFAALFDEYRLNKIVYKFIPMIDQIGVTSLTATTEPTVNIQYMTTVIDYDDASAPASYAALMDYETFKQTHPSRQHTRVFVPAVSAEFYRTGGATIAYGDKKKQWLDCAYTDVPHYGLKGYIEYGATHITSKWKVYGTAYLSFRNTR